MAEYPLARLLDTRRYREELAERDVAAAEARLEKAREDLREATNTLARYREWRPGEEMRLFELVRMKVLGQDELSAHREDVQALGRREVELEEACRASEKTVETALGDVAEAKRRRLAAMHGREKIESHRDRWLRDESERRARAEEAELEEFSRPGRQDEEEDEWT